MNKFNLTFSGEILPGQEPNQVKQRFGELFAINDRERLERFFSGETIILRRNLERKDAAECFQEMRRVGVVAELVKVTEPAEASATSTISSQAHSPTTQPRRKATKGTREPGARQGRAQDKAAWRRESEQRSEGEKGRNLQEETAARKRREEEKARKRQEEEAARKRREGENARKRLEREEARRRREEEKARKLAAREEALRAAEAEEARLRQERAEEAARQRIFAEEQRRQREQAEREQRERETAERRQREEAARLEREAAQQREREEAQRRRAIEEEKRRQARQQKAKARRERVQAQRNRKAAESRRRQEKRKQKDAQRREKAVLAAQQIEREKALREEQAQQRQGMEEVAIERAAQELTRGASLKPVEARVKTRLELPRRKEREDRSKAPAARKRQPGEPNFYALHPFRNTAEVRGRRQRAQRARRLCILLAIVALLGVLGLVGLQRQWGQLPIVAGAQAVGSQPDGSLVLAAGDRLLLHDRAGVPTAEMTLADLGLAGLHAPLVFTDNHKMLALGKLNDSHSLAVAGPVLLRCDLAQRECAPYLKEHSAVTSFASHSLDGSIFAANAGDGTLFQASADGEFTARTELSLPANPVLRPHGGLLLINSSQGPAISVYRYDADAFGQQLDEILLMPPAAIDAGHDRVVDFLWNAGTWWVLMRGTDGGDAGLYRFDEQWNFLGQPPLANAGSALNLAAWGSRVLANNGTNVEIARYNENGEVGAPLISASLQRLAQQSQQRARLASLGLGAGTYLSALLCIAALGIGCLQQWRALVYKPSGEAGAEPADDHLEQIRWVPPLPTRRRRLRRLGTGYTGLALAACILAVGQGVAASVLAALLLVLSGPAVALLLLNRRPVGNIGVCGDRLLLADHRGMYHFGSDATIAYRGNFLLMGDVVVFTGSKLLPAFSSAGLRQVAAPVVRTGMRVDRKTLLVKLLQARHPLAQGLLLVALGLVMATAMLALPLLR